MQNYYVANLAVRQGKNQSGYLNSLPEKSIEKAARDVIGRLGRYKALDLRVRLVTPKEAKILRRIANLRSRAVQASNELIRLHNDGTCMALRPKKSLAARRKLGHKKISRLVRRVKRHAAKKV